MTIREKLEDISSKAYFQFCGMCIELQEDDPVRIYDKVDGSCIFTVDYADWKKIPEELLNKEFKQVDIYKIPNTYIKPWALCFYLDKPEKVEQGISLKTSFRS